MPRPTVAQPHWRPSPGERLVMFTCIIDARRSGRITCLAADPGVSFADLRDETLRDWLRLSPPIGRLT